VNPAFRLALYFKTESLLCLKANISVTLKVTAAACAAYFKKGFNRIMDENQTPEIPEKESDDIAQDSVAESSSPYTPISQEEIARSVSVEKPQNERKKKSSRGVSAGTVAVIAALCIIATFMTTYVLLSVQYMHGGGTGSPSGGAMEQAAEKINALEALLAEDFIGELDEEVLTDWMLKGFMAGLGDPYAEYYTKDEFAALLADNRGEMQGIGISVTMDTDTGLIEIISVYPDSPALEAGVLPGDKIVYIIEDGQRNSAAEMGYSVAVSKLQGKADTFAEFVVQRVDSQGTAEEIEFSIKRGYITEYTVEGRLYAPDPTVGVIRITSFDDGTPDQFADAVLTLQNQGAKRLILDVRYNPGGELESVCSVLDSLLPEGPVIRTIDKDGNEEVVYTSDADALDMPLAVVVNEGTASAGELFASALQDYEKAPVVGVQTYGKGSMQTIRSFGDGTGFKYTYRYYCPPYSDNFDGVGVTPDIEVPLDEALAGKSIYKITDEEDNQLAAAYHALPEVK